MTKIETYFLKSLKLMSILKFQKTKTKRYKFGIFISTPINMDIIVFVTWIFTF
jgi:hypothetical protein